MSLHGVWLTIYAQHARGVDVFFRFLFGIFVDVLAGLDCDYPHILQDTLYRYLVLLGFGFGTSHTHWPEQWKRLAVFEVLREHLLAPGSKSSTQFQEDVDKFALGRGSDPDIAFATKRLDELDAMFAATKSGAAAASANSDHEATTLTPSAMLFALLKFDPAERPTMLELLQSSVFSTIRASQENSPATFDFYQSFTHKELPRV